MVNYNIYKEYQYLKSISTKLNVSLGDLISINQMIEFERDNKSDLKISNIIVRLFLLCNAFFLIRNI